MLRNEACTVLVDISNDLIEKTQNDLKGPKEKKTEKNNLFFHKNLFCAVI